MKAFLRTFVEKKQNDIAMKKRTLIAALTCLFALSANAQTYTNEYTPELKKLAHKWVKKGSWRNGFTKASPSQYVNEVEFYLQYQRNPEEWKALMQWLQTHDLLSVPAGRIPIEGTDLTVSVEDGDNWCSEQALREGQGSESHERKIDFMYVVKGKEGFARLDHDTSKDKTGYMADRDRHEYTFEADRLLRYESQEGTFEIMFPCDWHVAKVKTQEPSQHLRVLVIKVNYKL